jgi:predicted AAA+ superfamily ATPase
MIARRYESQILDLLTYFPALGIVGPRQVGKTTLVKMLTKKIPTSHSPIYIDLEYPPDLNKLRDPVLFFQQHPDSCIIIDEVQRKPDLFPILRSVIDQDRRPGRFILLGSASPELIRDTSETLAGRIAYIEITPFHLMEINNSHSYAHHWFWGGFPNALLAPNSKLASIWLQQFIQTYIERDLPMLGFTASPSVSRKLWQMIAHQNGNLLNASTLARSLGVSVPTISRYLDFFEESFLIRRLHPWEANSKKRLVKSPKIYIRDTGILHQLARIQDYDMLTGHPMLGGSWENYVIEQIAQLLPSEFSLHFYRTQAGAEADLIIANGLSPICCLEIKYSSAPKLSKGFMNVIEDLNTIHNLIITPSSETYQYNQMVKVTNLTDFLKFDLPKIA